MIRFKKIAQGGREALMGGDAHISLADSLLSTAVAQHCKAIISQ